MREPNRGRRAKSAEVDRLEPRRLLSGATTSIAIADADFDSLTKPGASAVAAMLPAGARTVGFGANVAVVGAGGGAALASFADATTGSSVDAPGWTVSPGATAGVENAPSVFAGKTDNFAYVDADGDTPVAITQTLAGFSLAPDTTYVLSVSVGSQNQPTPDGSPVEVDLEDAAGPLRASASSPSPFPGTLPTATRTYTTGANPSAGPITISLGIEARTQASEFDFDHVTLTATPGATPPTSPPTVAIQAALSAPAITASGQTTQTISAVYTDPAGVDTSSIDADNVMVQSADGTFLHVSGFTSSPATGVASRVTATYTVAAPFGTFTSADNGPYTITLPAGNISDADDNINAATTATFTVDAPGGPTAGTTDPTFDGGGAERTDMTVEAAVALPNGQLLVAGEQPGATAGSTQAVLQRRDANGAVDASFGASGEVVDSVGANEVFYDAAVQSDGKILAIGQSDGLFLLARYNPDGSPDISFGADGRLTFGISGDDAALGAAVEPSTGDIVFGGSTDGSAVVARFTPIGASDSTFNGDGFAVVDASSAGSAPLDPLFSKMAVESDGSIIAAGAAGSSVVVARLTPTGQLDPTFNAGSATPGVAVVSQLATASLPGGALDPSEGLALQTIGNQTDLLVANRTSDGHFGLVRLNADGTVDSSFGQDGLAVADFGGDDDADVVDVASDGDLFVSGTTTAAPTTDPTAPAGAARIAVAAFTPSGALDTSFANGGQEVFDTGVVAAAVPSADRAASANPQPAAVNLGGVFVQIFGVFQGAGQMVVGASQPSTGAGPASSFRRLNLTPTPTPTPVPTPTLPAGTAAESARLTGLRPGGGTLLAGSKTSAKVAVTISGAGGAALVGKIGVKLYLAPAASLTGAAQASAVSKTVKLKAGKSQTFNVNLSAIPKLSSGTYDVIADVVAPDGTQTAVVAGSVALAAAFDTATVSGVRPLAASASAGKPASLSLAVANTGNVPAAGAAPLTVGLSLQADGADPAPALSTRLRVNVKPGAKKTYTVKFHLPAGLAPGNYYLVVNLAGASIGDASADGMGVAALTIDVH